MKNLKGLLLSLIFAAISISSFAQIDPKKDTSDCETVVVGKSQISFDIGADLMSRYVWRGLEYGGSGPSVQPNICMTWGGLQLGFWGAYSLNGTNNTQELDLYASYTFLNEYLTIGFTDYFFTNELLTDEFLNYKSDSTGHVLEGSFSFNGTDKIPLSLLVAINLYGNDAHIVNDDPTSADFNKNDGIQYSTYVELGYSTSIKEISFDAFAGVNLTTPKSEDLLTGYNGEAGFYGSKAGLVNLGFTFGKEIKITEKFSLPISASIITNPLDKHYYFVCGISL
jgi:hypothetical protein